MEFLDHRNKCKKVEKVEISMNDYANQINIRDSKPCETLTMEDMYVPKLSWLASNTRPEMS